jgi:regulator of nonsense transcripts 2
MSECLYGIFLSGLVPRKIRLLAEQYQVSLPRSKLLTKEKQRNVKALLKDYYASLVKHVIKVRFDIMILGFMQ